MKDNVECMNCLEKLLVDLGVDECPSCGEEGTLAWVDGELQEVAA